MSDYILGRLEAKVDRLLEAAGIDYEAEQPAPKPPREKSEAELQALANAPKTPTADQLLPVGTEQQQPTITPVSPPATPAVTPEPDTPTATTKTSAAKG